MRIIRIRSRSERVAIMSVGDGLFSFRDVEHLKLSLR